MRIRFESTGCVLVSILYFLDDAFMTAIPLIQSGKYRLIIP